MPFVVIAFRGGVAFAFGGERMDDDRTILDLLRFVKGPHQRAHVVAVDIAYVFKSKFVDERTRQNRRGNSILHRFSRVMETFAHRWNRKECLLDLVFEAMITVRFPNSI